MYDLTPRNEMEASFDLLGRAAWSRANKQERAALVKARLERAIRKSLPTLELVMRDHLGDPNKLQAGVQRVGDLALDGKEGTDDVFGKLDQVESKLAEDYLGLITSERGEDVHTDDIIHNQASAARIDEVARGLSTRRPKGCRVGHLPPELLFRAVRSRAGRVEATARGPRLETLDVCGVALRRRH